MIPQKTATISARVSTRVRQLAKAVAQLSGLSLSSFAATAIEETARRELINTDQGRLQTREPAGQRGQSHDS